MGVVTGRRSRLDGVSTYRSASIGRQINLQELRHAGTAGGKQLLNGVEDWSGTYEEYGMVPTWFPGEEVTFTESVDGTQGMSGSAMITQTVITIPVGDKGPPTISGTFRGVGQLNMSDSTSVSMPSPADIPSTEGLCVLLATLSASPSYVAQAGTNEIVITLSIEPQEYHNCGSSGYMDALEGNWDATISYKRRCLPSELPAVGTPYHVKIPIDSAASEFYLFEYMRVGDISDITLNRESGEILNCTIPLEMSIIEEIGGSATLGSGVTKPDTDVWRPDET
jgi:hypothetical protein